MAEVQTDNLQRQIWNATCDANTLNSTLTNLDHCQTTNDINGINTLVSGVANIQDKYNYYKTVIDDLNATGEQIVGQSANPEQISNIDNQLKDLLQQQKDIQSQIDSYKAISDVNAQDFIDTRERLPETLPTTRFHVLEDYTLAIFLGSLILLSTVFLFMYISAVGFSFMNIFQAVFVSSLFALIVLTIIYYTV